MEKSLGTKIADSIKEICDLEALKLQLSSCLFDKNLDKRINESVSSIEDNFKQVALSYGVKYDNYSDKIEKVKAKFLTKANDLKNEYEFQFMNLQLELRELLANQKVALVNAKKCLDYKKEKQDKDQISAYDSEKEKYLKKYILYNSLIKDCENKIQNCMEEAYNEIERVIGNVFEVSLAVNKKNAISKCISKITNIFSGKSKFEGKLNEIENKTSYLEEEIVSKIEQIKENTVDLVGDILNQVENLDAQSA